MKDIAFKNYGKKGNHPSRIKIESRHISQGPFTYYVMLHTVFYVKRVKFFPVNRVEHQQLNQTTAELPFD